MFKYWKEMRDLKKRNLLFKTALLEKIYEYVDSFTEIGELANKSKDLSGTDFQKMVVEEVLKRQTTTEKSE